MSASIEHRAEFDFIRYANCWEDADILRAALRPSPGKTFLSIGSGGDNCFALLQGGARVVAVDLNPAQLACIELKREAVRSLDHAALLGFLGIAPEAERPAVYRSLAPGLSEAARGFWDAHPEAIEMGIVHFGKFERYFQTFRRRVLPLMHSRKTVEALFQPRDRAGREAFYEKKWNHRRWRWMFRIFFSRFVMGRLGRDPEFFRYVDGSVADRIMERARYALTVLPTDGNPYLGYILTGNFTRGLPPWLEPARYDALKANLDGLTLVEGSIQAAVRDNGASGFDGFNLSDLFEYLDPAACEALYGDLLAHARPGARFAYWNMLAPRQCPETFADRVKPLPELSRKLFEEDRAFFYSRFVVEEVCG